MHHKQSSLGRATVIEKNNAEGSDNFQSAQERFSEVLRGERIKYVEILKAKLAALPRDSKQW